MTTHLVGGKALDPSCFNIFDNGVRTLTPRDCRNLYFGHRRILSYPPFSIVYTVGNVIVGHAYGAKSASDAAVEAGVSIHESYRIWGEELPFGNVTAVINYPIHLGGKSTIAGHGVDVLLSLVPMPEDQRNGFLKDWVDRHANGIVTDITYPRIYLEPRWNLNEVKAKKNGAP